MLGIHGREREREKRGEAATCVARKESGKTVSFEDRPGRREAKQSKAKHIARDDAQHTHITSVVAVNDTCAYVDVLLPGKARSRGDASVGAGCEGGWETLCSVFQDQKRAPAL